MTGQQAEYFAVPDPADPTRMTYWRRTAGRLHPWPPRARYGPLLLTRDVPTNLTGDARRAYVLGWFRDHSEPWSAAVHAAIAADPYGCAARFAVMQTRCCWCGRRLTDPASKTYGIGPDCRAGYPAVELALMAEAVGRAHAAATDGGGVVVAGCGRGAREASCGPLSAILSQDPGPARGAGSAGRETEQGR